MNVVLLNCSPHKEGCTNRALTEIQKELAANGVESEIVWMGKSVQSSCIDCRSCAATGRCVFDKDIVNELLGKVLDADGLIVGSPVYYANVNGSCLSLLDRLFILSKGNFRFKFGASVVSARRGGTSASLSEIDKFFQISKMPIVSSSYWNMVHGNTPEEVEKDEEGLQTMRVLAQNMAYLIKCKYAGEKAGIMPPTGEKKVRTNFTR